MPKTVHCVICNRHVSECGPLSARKRCFDCGSGQTRINALELNAHSGAYFKRWRARSIAALGAEVPDDLKPYLE